MADAPNLESGGPGTRANSIPVLGEGFSEQPESMAESFSQSSEPQSPDQEGKSSRRRFWGLGRKKESAQSSASPSSRPIPTTSTRTSTGSGSRAPRNGTQTPSPSRQPTTFGTSSPSSPARMRSPSPASSQIFERNVQEDALLLATNSPSSAAATVGGGVIPAHITTENHIPPALSASANAFADERLSPDRVEIVTLASHQPAAATVTGTVSPDLADSTASLASPLEPHDHTHALAATQYPHHQPHHPHLHAAGSASLHSPTQTSPPHSVMPPSLDATDIRRLSFISFADVVHDEHVTPDTAQRAAGSGVLASSLASLSSSPPPRSPSPVVSPTSIGAGTGAGAGSDLSVETMRQALRKTGSGSGDWEMRDGAVVGEGEGTS